MASSGAGGWLFVWDASSRKSIAQIRTGIAPTALVFLDDTNLLAVGDNHGGVSIWNTSTQALQRRYAGHEKLVSGIAVSPDGKRLATAAHDGTLKIWEVVDEAPGVVVPAR